MEWGTVPAWVTAAAAGLALIFAAGAYRREGRRDHVNAELRLREQANKVAAWEDVLWADDVIEHDPTGEQSPVREERFVVQIRNSSDLPIERVLADLVDDATGEVLHTARTRLVKPETTESIDLPSSLFALDFAVRLRFMDAQGVSWERWGGTLEPESDRSKQPAWWRSFEYEPGVIVTIWGVALAVLGDVFGRVRRRR